LTRGARIATVPDPTVTLRSRAWPLRHDQPPAVLVALINQRRDVLIDLRPKRRRDHPPSALPSEIIQRDLQLLVVLPDREPANIHHGVPSCRPSPASVLINREGTPPSSSSPSTTSGYSSVDVISGGVRAGIAGPQNRAERLASACGQQWVKSEAALVVAGSRLPCRNAP
jgi:hypothetical protein